MVKSDRISIPAVFMILFLIAGCSKPIIQHNTQPVSDIVWPRPPEIPRIRFVKSISQPEDMSIKKGRLVSFFRYVLGIKDAPIVAPFCMEIDSSGRMYVVDTFLKVIHVYDIVDNEHFTFPSSDDHEFVSPVDIAIDNATGRIFVTDSKRCTISVFSDKGKKFLMEMGEGILERPTGIAVNTKTSELLVVDTTVSRIVRFDLATLKFKGHIGRNNPDGLHLHYPTQIHVSNDGDIFITDALNFRIQVLSPEGKQMLQFGSAGDQIGYFSRPRGVSVDSDGNIYVVDCLLDTVQIFDKKGRLLLAFGRAGKGDGEFWLPAGIFIDQQDRIYIADTYNKRIQVFQYIKKD